MKFSYDVSRQKLIYIFSIDDAAHHGLLKIGDATLTTGDLDADAHKRIDEYTRTAGIDYQLRYTELAVKDNGDAFRDYDVHRVLISSGIKKKSPAGTGAREWFAVDFDTALKAIAAVKQSRKNILGMKSSKKISAIIFRDEQKEVITRTVKYFNGKRNGNSFLWNAKMRFGKTLCALEVVRQLKFAKTIIITHRPVVNAGWREDFDKIFRDGTVSYVGVGDNFDELIDSGKHFVCFASIQDLRGSETVGGSFDKNARLFDTQWDCVIVDEAHEGTTTEHGDKVIDALRKPHTKFLALSGTPFNILDDFDEETTFTWDYVDEQRAKKNWDVDHAGESNPYDDLPQLNILTYDLGKLIGQLDDSAAFNFTEFFRTVDGSDTFVHADAMKKFLDLLVTLDDNNYPFANQTFRDMFRHTLWIIPDIKAGRALSAMLKRHKIFGTFKVVNVAGDGDSDDKRGNALKKVEDAIEKNSYTITLSCGKLTAGVTVREWSAVFMLTGGSSATAYLQTIFRVQSPCHKGGAVKENCYVFDFAPDRTLTMVAEAVAVKTRAGKTSTDDRAALADLLNFCPVIAMHGSEMKRLDEKNLLTQLKRVYAERAVRKGFDDNGLYSEEFLHNLTDADIENLTDIGNIITKADGKSSGTITVTDSGLDKPSRKRKKRPPHELSPEEIAKRQSRNVIRILRGVSIRMPLMIYGADVPLDDDIPIERFTDLIDDESWQEFMPADMTKEKFLGVIKFYDPEVFINAGHIVRRQARDADNLSPAERVTEIAKLFATFKNPDKETVLTPWRVVDLHLTSLPQKIFAPDKKILDINSKTGLYPLWSALKIFHARTKPFGTLSLEAQRLYWNRVVADNIFVLCKTPMAVTITRRTLLGYRDGIVNAKFFPDLIATLKTKPDRVVAHLADKNFWSKGVGKMFFDAVVGNPPYQTAVAGDNKNYASPVYHLFIAAAFKLADKVSLIHPARCLSNAGDVPKEFNQKLLADPHVKVVRYESDSSEFFPTSDIKGGVVITYRDAQENFGAIGTFIKFAELDTILHKVVAEKNFKPFSEIVRTPVAYRLSEKFFSGRPELICKLQKPNDSALRTNILERLPEIFLDAAPDDGNDYIQILGRVENRRVYKFIRRDYITDENLIDRAKIFLNEANGTGEFGERLTEPFVVDAGIGSTQTFITVGAFDTRAEADACLKYIKTKFCRALLGVLKVTQHNPPATWAKVPLQNFTADGDLDWSTSIADLDAQLYRKYNLTAEEISFIESHVKPMA